MPDTVALFNCTAIATFINWKINDTPVDQFTSEQFQEQASVVVNVTQSLISETLRVLGSLENNKIRIVCVAVLEVSSNMFSGASSDPAVMFVQGTGIYAIAVLTGLPQSCYDF